MKRISAYFISALLFILSTGAKAQDTINYPLKIKLGIDLVGPVAYFADKNTLAFEGFLSYDRDTSKSYVLEAGYLNFRYSQYNYEYHSSGIFLKAGVDFNLLSPFTGRGNYYAGIGIRYGLSIFSSEVPSLEYENYWGTVSESIPMSDRSAHFLEVSPGLKTELFRNFYIGWTVRLRLLVYSSSNKDVKSIYIPGFGNGSRSFSPGLSYHIIWSFPYKHIEIR